MNKLEFLGTMILVWSWKCVVFTQKEPALWHALTSVQLSVRTCGKIKLYNNKIVETLLHAMHTLIVLVFYANPLFFDDASTIPHECIIMSNCTRNWQFSQYLTHANMPNIKIWSSKIKHLAQSSFVARTKINQHFIMNI